MLNSLQVFDRFKAPIALSLVGIVLILGGVFASGINKPAEKNFPKESMVQKEEVKVVVDVEGAVSNPGVYKLDSTARIADVIKLAGGFLEKANKEYIAKSLNLAQKLVDGSKIYIPFESEVISSSYSGQTGSVAGASTQSKININSASQSELEALSGIGPVSASKIISSRPYQNIEELVSKKAIGSTIFEKIKDQLVAY